MKQGDSPCLVKCLVQERVGKVSALVDVHRQALVRGRSACTSTAGEAIRIILLYCTAACCCRWPRPGSGLSVFFSFAKPSICCCACLTASLDYNIRALQLDLSDRKLWKYAAMTLQVDLSGCNELGGPA